MKRREFIARLKKVGVAEYPARGKGGERLLIRETARGSKKGKQYSLAYHGENQDVPRGSTTGAPRNSGPTGHNEEIFTDTH